MHKYLVLSGIVSLCLISSCQDKTPVPPTATGSSQYFDLAGFIQEQVRVLNAEKPVAVKSVQEAGKTIETKTVKDLNWAKELESFAEVDLNKPAYRQAYTVARQEQPNGLITETYRRKPNAESAIELVAITRNQQNQVTLVQATQQNDNMLVTSRKEMQLTCYTKNGVNRVGYFRIEGLQKPLLFDALHYTISTKIR